MAGLGLSNAVNNFMTTYDWATRKQLMDKQIAKQETYDKGLDDAYYDATHEQPAMMNGTEAVGPVEQTPLNKPVYYGGLQDAAAKAGDPAKMREADQLLNSAKQEGFRDMYQSLITGNAEEGLQAFNKSGALRIDPATFKTDYKNNIVTWKNHKGQDRRLKFDEIAALGGVKVTKPDYSHIKTVDGNIYNAKNDTFKAGPGKPGDSDKMNDTTKWFRATAASDYKNETGNFNQGDSDKVGIQALLAETLWRTKYKSSKELMQDANVSARRTISKLAEQANAYLDKQVANGKGGMFSGDSITVNGQEVNAEDWKAQQYPTVLNKLVDGYVSQLRDGKQAGQANSTFKEPPKAAIDKLASEDGPEMRKFFDQMYGKGAAELYLSKIPGSEKTKSQQPSAPASEFGNIKGLEDAQTIAARQEAARPKTRQELDQTIQGDIANSMAAREQGAQAMGAKFGLENATPPEERGQAYNNMAMSFTNVVKAVKSGQIPEQQDLEVALRFAQGKNNTQAVQELQAMIDQYYSK